MEIQLINKNEHVKKGLESFTYVPFSDQYWFLNPYPANVENMVGF